MDYGSRKRMTQKGLDTMSITESSTVISPETYGRIVNTGREYEGIMHSYHEDSPHMQSIDMRGH